METKEDNWDLIIISALFAMYFILLVSICIADYEVARVMSNSTLN